MIVKLGDDIPVKIYELRDPRDISKSPRYIGITIKELNSRLSRHLTKNSLKSKTYKNRWITKLLKESVKPTIHLIEEVIGWSYACEVEKYWIKEFKNQGYKLTNSTEGGEGSVGIVVRKDTRKKLSKNSSGKNNAMYGKSGELSPCWGLKHSEETKLKRKNSVAKTIHKKQLQGFGGISKNIKTGNWEAILWLKGRKICLGTFANKKNAEEVRLFGIKLLEDSSITNRKIKERTDIFRKKEWFRKLIKKSPEIKYWKERNKFVVRMSTNPGRKHLGICKTKEEAFNIWNVEIQRLAKIYLI